MCKYGMLTLPNEIIIQIISYADCYVKLVLSNDELDERQLFREGGPGLLLDKVLERGADRALLMKMKERYFTRGARIPIYKAIAITKDPNILSLVCSIWESNISNIGLELGYKLRLCWGIEMVDTPYRKEKYLNAVYLFRGEMDRLDPNIGLPELYNMDDIIQCYKDEKIRPCLRTEELIAYHIRMGNDDIIKDMNVDVYAMLSVANQISCITRDEQIRLFCLRNKNSQHDNLCAPRMALKLELWDETLRPELFRAVSEKDYVTVNKFIHDEHVGITSGVIKDLKEAGYIPYGANPSEMNEYGEWNLWPAGNSSIHIYRKSKEKTSNDDKELDNRQWFINHLSNHPEIEIVEKTIGGLSMIDPYRYEGDEYISGHSINTIDTYVDEDNPGDIGVDVQFPISNLYIAIRWYYRNRMAIKNFPLLRNRVDF